MFSVCKNWWPSFSYATNSTSLPCFFIFPNICSDSVHGTLTSYFEWNILKGALMAAEFSSGAIGFMNLSCSPINQYSWERSSLRHLDVFLRSVFKWDMPTISTAPFHNSGYCVIDSNVMKPP